MPNDYVTLNALCLELKKRLVGARIDKIKQPEKDELQLTVKTASSRESLVISCNPQSSRIHLSQEKKESPMTAPTFCMSARKHIGGGLITNFSLPFNDRIVDIEITSRNEMNDIATFHLIAELMGRYSNIILTNAQYKVLDCVKRISYDTATKRCIMPSVTYEPPCVPRVNITSPDDAAKLALTAEGDAAKFFAKNISGVSLETAEEIFLSSGFPDGGQEGLKNTIKNFLSPEKSGILKPCVLLKNGKPSDYFIFPYGSMTNAQWQQTSSLNDAVSLCLRIKDEAERTREKCKPLASALKNYINKNRKKLTKNLDKLSECDNMDNYRAEGELILNNIYAYKSGDTFLNATDYSKENCPIVKVELNGTPQETAKALFKKYNKLKRAKEVALVQAEECRQLLDYAESISQSLETSVTENDYKEIEKELIMIGAMRKKAVRDKKNKPAQPLSGEIEGFRFCVGKNNIQNDQLTFKTAHGGDIWFHTLDYHGSHLVLFTENREVPDTVKTKAAEIAAYFSKGRDADKIPVDYTLIKYVKRHPSKALGMVVYTNQTTIFVKPTPYNAEMV